MLNVLNFLHSPKIDTDSPFIVYPIKTDIFPGELNNTFQTNVMFSASKEGQHKICMHVVHNGYVNDSCYLYSREYMKKNYFLKRWFLAFTIKIRGVFFLSNSNIKTFILIIKE